MHWWSAFSFLLGAVCARVCECPHRQKSKNWGRANMGAVAQKLIDCDHTYWYERFPGLDAANSELEVVQRFYRYSIYIYIIQGYSKWLSRFQQLVIHNTLEIGVYVFFYLIEQHSKFLLHTLQVLYMCTLCDSTNINTIIERNEMKCKQTTRFLTATILVNCASSGEMHNYCTPHIIKKLREFLDPSVQLHTPISSVLFMTSC
jgi:hypothetical protein